MLTQDQIQARKIGGSSAAKVMGASKYCTRYNQWQYDTGQIEKEDLSDKIDIIVGNKLEDPMRKVIGGINIDPGLLSIKDKPYWSGYIDGYRDDTVIELKTSIDFRRNIDFGQSGTDEIPLDYLYQVQHYLMHPRFNHAELYVVFLPYDLKKIIAEIDFSEDDLIKMVSLLEIRSYKIEPDILMMDDMITEYKYYWDCVQNVTPPTLLNYEEVVQAYNKSKPGAIEATDEDLLAINRIKAIKDEVKELNAEEKQKKFEICNDLGEDDTMISGEKKLCTWKSNKNGIRSFRLCKKGLDYEQ